MSYTFVNRPKVNSDILNIVDYYKEINPQLPKEFLNRIKEAKIYIEKSPLGFQIKYREVRTVLLKQFPYHIHYIIDEPKKLVVVLAIIHSYKNPLDYSGR